MTKIADGMLEPARELRVQEEAKEAREDGLPVPAATSKRARSEDDEDEDEDKGLQGDERAAAIASVLTTPEPIAARLKKATSGKHRKAMLLTGEEAMQELLEKAEAKEAEAEAKSARARERAEKKAAKAAEAVAAAARPVPKQRRRSLLGPLLTPAAASSSSSSSSSSAAASSASSAALVMAGAGVAPLGAIRFGGGSDFHQAMAGAEEVV